MLRSERRSKKTKRNEKDDLMWHPRGDKLIPGHRVEDNKKGKGSSYDRQEEKFDWRKFENGKYDE